MGFMTSEAGCVEVLVEGDAWSRHMMVDDGCVNV